MQAGFNQAIFKIKFNHFFHSLFPISNPLIFVNNFEALLFRKKCVDLLDLYRLYFY
jgi:hypothetical protein